MFNVEKFQKNISDDFERRQTEVISSYQRLIKNTKDQSIKDLFNLFWSSDRSVIYTIFNRLMFISNPKLGSRNELEMMEGFLFVVLKMIEDNAKFGMIRIRFNADTGVYERTELSTADTFVCLTPEYEDVECKVLTCLEITDIILDELAKGSKKEELLAEYFPEYEGKEYDNSDLNYF